MTTLRVVKSTCVESEKLYHGELLDVPPGTLKGRFEYKSVDGAEAGI